MSKKVLKFRDTLESFRRMKARKVGERLKVSEMANLAGIKVERMEDIMEGTHCPTASDVLRMMRGFDIVFSPEDFEEYGI